MGKFARSTSPYFTQEQLDYFARLGEAVDRYWAFRAAQRERAQGGLLRLSATDWAMLRTAGFDMSQIIKNPKSHKEWMHNLRIGLDAVEEERRKKGPSEPNARKRFEEDREQAIRDIYKVIEPAIHVYLIDHLEKLVESGKRPGILRQMQTQDIQQVGDDAISKFMNPRVKQDGSLTVSALKGLLTYDPSGEVPLLKYMQSGVQKWMHHFYTKQIKKTGKEDQTIDAPLKEDGKATGEDIRSDGALSVEDQVLQDDLEMRADRMVEHFDEELSFLYGEMEAATDESRKAEYKAKIENLETRVKPLLGQLKTVAGHLEAAREILERPDHEHYEAVTRAVPKLKTQYNNLLHKIISISKVDTQLGESVKSQAADTLDALVPNAPAASSAPASPEQSPSDTPAMIRMRRHMEDREQRPHEEIEDELDRKQGYFADAPGFMFENAALSGRLKKMLGVPGGKLYLNSQLFDSLDGVAPQDHRAVIEATLSALIRMKLLENLSLGKTKHVTQSLGILKSGMSSYFLSSLRKELESRGVAPESAEAVLADWTSKTQSPSGARAFQYRPMEADELMRHYLYNKVKNEVAPDVAWADLSPEQMAEIADLARIESGYDAGARIYHRTPKDIYKLAPWKNNRSPEAERAFMQQEMDRWRGDSGAGLGFMSAFDPSTYAPPAPEAQEPGDSDDPLRPQASVRARFQRFASERQGNVFRLRLVADTHDKRERGLMFTEPLADDEAAFFVFPTSARHAFWNKNVPYRLSLAFLDENGRIVDFADMDADSAKSVAPAREARYVVEASHGTFERIGAKKGDLIEYADHSLRFKKVVG